MTLREAWKTKKKESEEAFKKEHAKEVLKVHTDGLTPYPIKYDLGLGPALENLESAQKKKKDADIKKYLDKSKEIVGKYHTRIENNKDALGTAYKAVHDGIEYLQKILK
jgi:ribosome-binding protein aMBF1 (putative translation factor)